MDEKFQWLETRIKSSLQPRNDDLKNFFKMSKTGMKAFNKTCDLILCSRNTQMLVYIINTILCYLSACLFSSS